MAMLIFCIRRLSILLYVVSVLCFVSPAFSAAGDVDGGDGDVGIDDSWDVKALTSYLPLYDSALQVSHEDTFIRQGVALSPKEGEVLAFSQQRKIAILSKPLLSEGQFLYRENAGICWAINKPFPATLVLTESSIIQKSDDGSEQIIDASKNPMIAELTGLFTSIFAGDSQKILSAFDVYLLQGQPSLMPKAGWMLGMKPKADLMVGIPSEIRLLGKENLRWAWFSNKAGDQTLIEFADVNGSQSENIAARCFERI